MYHTQITRDGMFERLESSSLILCHSPFTMRWKFLYQSLLFMFCFACFNALAIKEPTTHSLDVSEMGGKPKTPAFSLKLLTVRSIPSTVTDMQVQQSARRSLQNSVTIEISNNLHINIITHQKGKRTTSRVIHLLSTLGATAPNVNTTVPFQEPGDKVSADHGPLKLETDTLESPHFTPLMEQSTSIMDRPNSKSSTMSSVSKDVLPSSVHEKQSTKLQQATSLRTSNGLPSSVHEKQSTRLQQATSLRTSNGLSHKTIVPQKSESISHTSSLLPKDEYMDSTIKTVSNVETESQGLSYATMLPPTSSQTETSEENNITMTTQLEGTETRGTDHESTSSPVPILITLNFKRIAPTTPKLMTTTSKPTESSSVYSSPGTDIPTSSQMETRQISTVSTSPISSLSSQVNVANFSTTDLLSISYSTVIKASLSSASVMATPGVQSTFSIGRFKSPVSSSPWLARSYQKPIQSSSNVDIDSGSLKPTKSFNRVFMAKETTMNHAAPRTQQFSSLLPKSFQSNYLKLKSPVHTALPINPSNIKTMVESESHTPKMVLGNEDRDGLNLLPSTHGRIHTTTSYSTAPQFQHFEMLHVPSISTTLTLHCRLVGIQFSLDLLHQSTKAYKSLAEEVQYTMGKIFSGKYGSNYLGIKIKDFLKDRRTHDVIVQAEILFKESASLPSSSDLVRTILTEIYRNTHNYFAWQIDPASVNLNGKSMKNLDPEKISISFVSLRTGSSASSMIHNSPLEVLQNEIIKILSAFISLNEFILMEAKDINGDLSIKGDLYISTVTNTDSRQILLALKNLDRLSVDLSSLIVNDVQLSLDIYSFSFRVINRELTKELLDYSTLEFKQFALDLEMTLANALENSSQPLQVIVRELIQSNSVLCRGDLIFLRPAPPGEEVLQDLRKTVGSRNILNFSPYMVDPDSFTIDGTKADVHSRKGVVSANVVAIMALCIVFVLFFPTMIMLCLKSNVCRSTSDKDQGKSQTKPESGRKLQDPEKGKIDAKPDKRTNEKPIKHGTDPKEGKMEQKPEKDQKLEKDQTAPKEKTDQKPGKDKTDSNEGKPDFEPEKGQSDDVKLGDRGSKPLVEQQ